MEFVCLRFQMSPIRWFALHQFQNIKHCSEVVGAVWPPSHSRREKPPQSQTCQTRQRYATICNDMQRYATICNDMQRCATMCNDVQRCYHMVITGGIDLSYWHVDTCCRMLPHVATMKGPLQVLLVREVNAIGRHIRCAFSNCGAQKQGKGVQSGRNCARDVPNHSECVVFVCPWKHPFSNAMVACWYLTANLGKTSYLMLSPLPSEELFPDQVFSLQDAQADITYSTCCDMRCTQQRARQSICSGRELSVLSTDCTKPSPTMNIMNIIIN